MISLKVVKGMKLSYKEVFNDQHIEIIHQVNHRVNVDLLIHR